LAGPSTKHAPGLLPARPFRGILKGIGNPEATCAESWRHSVTTLRQDATVDPVIRPQVMGPQADCRSWARHDRPRHPTPHETLRQPVAQALWRCPESLRYAMARLWPRSTSRFVSVCG
jgi:hypothetical protein